MRTVIWVLILAAAVVADHAVTREEHLEEQNDCDEHDRRKRDTYVEGPFEEHIRVKRGWKKAQNEENVRSPRGIHQYEVHEHHNEDAPPVAPYEEMLVASAEHYHKVYVAPPAARSLKSDGAPVAAVQPVDVAEVAVPATFSVSNFAAHNPAHVTPDAGVLPKEDLTVSAGHHHEKHHPYSYAKSGGNQHHGDHYSEHGGKGTTGGKSHHYVDKGQKGFKTDHLHRKEYEDAEGLRKKHHDEASHKGDHEEEAFGSRGSHFGEKKGHKKGHKTKGFHNKYHKDEFQKEHKFYDDFHKGGEHHRYGKFNAKHSSNESGKKKVHQVKAGHDFTEHGKKGYSNKGHLDADHKGYRGKSGHDEHHHHHSQHGKKGGRDDSSQRGYKKN